VRFVNGLGVSAFVPSIALGSGKKGKKKKGKTEEKGALPFLFLQNDSIFIGEKISLRRVMWCGILVKMQRESQGIGKAL